MRQTLVGMCLLLCGVVGCSEPMVGFFGRVLVQGPVLGAEIELVALEEDGGTGTTLDASSSGIGDFSLLSFETSQTGCVLISALGGDYRDFTDPGDALGWVAHPSHDERQAWSCDFDDQDFNPLSITALSHMAAMRAAALTSQGVPVDLATKSSNISIAQQFGLADAVLTDVADASNADEMAVSVRSVRRYGIVLAGLAQQAATLGVPTRELGWALARDAADGILDGLDDGDAIDVPARVGDDAVPLPDNAATSDLQAHIDAFLASENNASGLTEHHVNQDSLPLGAQSDGGLRIITTAVAAWVDGVPASFKLEAAGGSGSYCWSGELPPPFTLDGDGTIRGEASLAPGTSMRVTPPFTVTVVDCNDPLQERSAAFAITIVEPPPEVTILDCPPMKAGEPYDCQIADATGGSPPYHCVQETGWGFPPFGITLEPLTCALHGTPSLEGERYDFKVCVVDLIGSFGCGRVKGKVGRGEAIVGGFDGDYTCDVTTTTPIGTNTGTGTFSCTGGACADPSGTFAGTVDGSGAFTGSSIVCAGCDPIAISGVFSLTEPFTLSSPPGSTTQTLVCTAG